MRLPLAHRFTRKHALIDVAADLGHTSGTVEEFGKRGQSDGS